jgi:hypothetical protein
LALNGKSGDREISSEPEGVRIPVIATTHSGGSRPPIPIDRDQFESGVVSTVECIR